MKKLQIKALIFLFSSTLAACSGGKIEYLDYVSTPAGTTGLDMRAAIYKATLPSGNILTITTDQSDNNIFGAYTIKSGSTIISSGEVKNQVSNISLIAYTNSVCPNEAILIVPSNVNTARDAAEITISGVSCSEGSQLPATKTISKFVPPTSATLTAVGSNQEIQISLISGDNVNFVGSIDFSNTSQKSSGTIVATANNNSSITRNINDLDATGLRFDRVSNYSGNFFGSNITRISGQISTTAPSLAGPFYANQITVTPYNINTALPSITFSTLTTQSYTPQ